MATAERISAERGRADAVTAVTADLTDPEQLDRVLAAVGDRPVDVVVNNAGGYLGGDTGTLAGVAAQWRANLDANVLTAVLLTEALRPALRRPGGRVILVSSIAAQRGGGGAYSAAKAALHGWAYDLAAQLGPEQITVNVVSPGYVAETEFFGDRMTAEGTRAGSRRRWSGGPVRRPTSPTRFAISPAPPPGTSPARCSESTAGRCSVAEARRTQRRRRGGGPPCGRRPNVVVLSCSTSRTRPLAPWSRRRRSAP
ncbi:hypothetical protein GCM10027614_56570 [Micromonospora vulcania]